MFRVARFIYMLVAGVFLTAAAVDSLWVSGARTIPLSGQESLERALVIVAIPVLAGLIFCCIKLRSCRLSALMVLTVLWLGIYTWFEWFSSSAPARITEYHSFDPIEIRAETLRHYALVTASYLVVVAAFSILPVLKFLDARRGRSSGRPS